jgi:hypothetical protein
MRNAVSLLLYLFGGLSTYVFFVVSYSVMFRGRWSWDLPPVLLLIACVLFGSGWLIRKRRAASKTDTWDQTVTSDRSIP